MNGVKRGRITDRCTILSTPIVSPDSPIRRTTDVAREANPFTYARSDGADIVVTGGDETTRLKRALVTYDATAGELELYVRIRGRGELGWQRALAYGRVPPWKSLVGSSSA